MSSTISYRFDNPQKASFWQIIWISCAVVVIFIGVLSSIIRYQIELESTRSLFAEALPRLGIDRVFYAMFRVGMEVLLNIVCSSAGLFLFLRQRKNPMILLVAMTLILFGASTGLTFTIPYMPPLLLIFAATIRILSRLALIGFGFTFPDGHFIPPWSKHFVLVSFVAMVAVILFEINVGVVLTAFDVLIGAFIGVIAIGAQVYRARKVSSPKERQQNKWVIFGFITFILGIVVFSIVDIPITPYLKQNPEVRVLYRMIFTSLTTYLPSMVLPMTMVFAVARERLWEVDLTINRSIVYGIVTTIFFYWFLDSFSGWHNRHSEIFLARTMRLWRGLLRRLFL
jgi:hypothetical protein